MSEDEKSAQTSLEVDQNAAEEASPKKPKKKTNRMKILIGVIAAVAIVGIGFWQWHETPEFCVSICHKPMNHEYLDTLYANPYEPAYGAAHRGEDAMSDKQQQKKFPFTIVRHVV